MSLETVTLPSDRAGRALQMALRYAMSRRTALYIELGPTLKEAWPSLPSGTKDLIKRDLREEVDLHDRWVQTAKSPMGVGPLGHQCDYDAWRNLLAWLESNP